MWLLKTLLISFIAHSAASPLDLRGLESQKYTNPYERRYSYASNLMTWPQGSNSGFHTIPYGYADYDSWDQLDDLVTQAIALWTKKLGDANQANQHSLRIIEYEIQGDDDVEKFCLVYKPKSNDPNRDTRLDFTWNPLFNRGTLMIQLQKGAQQDAEASVGYTNSDRAGRHAMVISLGAATDDDRTMVVAIAHELGHVFGLRHEQQRADRDKYLHFDCSNLEGYQDAVNNIQSNGNQHTIEAVCGDEALCKAYGFSSGAEYAKREVAGGQYITTEMSQTLDFDSIMLYASKAYRNLNKNPNNIKNLPLLRWINPNQATIPDQVDATNAVLIPQNVVPSDGDKAAIQKLYPWSGP